MNTLRSITGLVWIFVIFQMTWALPEWHNSTDGREYLIESAQKYNWFQAQHECARKNLQLVEIHEHAKNEALVALLKSIFGFTKNLWLGANDEYNLDRDYKRSFYWTTSGKEMTFSYWSNDNPDNHRTNEHCVHTWENADDFRWNDVPCDSFNMGYICEGNYLHDDALAHETEDNNDKSLSPSVLTLFRDFEAYQKLQMTKLVNIQNDIVQEAIELKEQIEKLKTNLEFDKTYALAQHQRDLKLALEYRNKMLSNLNQELSSAAEVMSKKFKKELEGLHIASY